jgi:hypothetical protein
MIMVSANTGVLASAAHIKGMNSRARTARDMNVMAMVLRRTTLEVEGG